VREKKAGGVEEAEGAISIQNPKSKIQNSYTLH
jgi:hypothetical protein